MLFKNNVQTIIKFLDSILIVLYRCVREKCHDNSVWEEEAADGTQDHVPTANMMETKKR